MARILGMLQVIGVAVLLMAAGASDGGRLSLSALALWLAVGMLLIGAGLAPWRRILGALHRRHRPYTTAARASPMGRRTTKSA